jgi:hypothetical protein
MSGFTFQPARRESIPLLIGIAGGTGSGKTYSALRLAKGLAGDKPFAVIDTEAGRAKHYADLFDFQHGDLMPPFRPERYDEAILAAEQAGYPVIVVDSFSHEYAGEGGLLDWHDEELTRMAGQDWKKREAMTFSAWVRPKMAHKAFVSKLLQLRSHLIVCLRAEEKIDIVKGEDGKTKVVPKKTLSGHVGWIPIAEKSFAYELTLSVVMTPDAPGIAKPIKIQEQHKAFVPLDQPLSEETGKRLAEWARGGTGAESTRQVPKTGTDEPDAEAPSAPETTPEAPPPASASSPSRTDATPPAPQVISQAQRRRLFAIAREHGIEEVTLRAYVKAEKGDESTGDMTVGQYEAVVAKLEGAAIGSAA